jgi:hypothetical protein
MNCIRWAAWGVVDIENIPSDQTTGGNRQARRSYLKKVHEELKPFNMTLHIGGSTQVPWYAINVFRGIPDSKPKQVAAGKDAFKKICTWVLEQVGDTAKEEHDVSSEDGGVRRAGDEAQSSEGA